MEMSRKSSPTRSPSCPGRDLRQSSVFKAGQVSTQDKIRNRLRRRGRHTLWGFPIRCLLDRCTTQTPPTTRLSGGYRGPQITARNPTIRDAWPPQRSTLHECLMDTAERDQLTGPARRRMIPVLFDDPVSSNGRQAARFLLFVFGGPP